MGQKTNPNKFPKVKPLFSFYYPICIEAIRNACKKKSGCYAVKNEITGDLYVGSGMSGTRLSPFKQRRYAILGRYKDHFIFQKQTNRHLKNAIKKYGIKNFSFHILEFTRGSPIKREQFFFDLLKPKYNILKIAGSNFGFRHSLKSRKRMSIDAKIQKRHQRFDIGAYNKGSSMTPTQKKKISKSLKNHFKNPIFRFWHRRRSIESTGRPVIVTDMKTERFLYRFSSVSKLSSDFVKGKVSYKHLLDCALHSKEVPSLGIRLRYEDVPYTKPKRRKYPRQVGCYYKGEEKPFKIYESVKAMSYEVSEKITWERLRERARKEAYIPELGFIVKFIPND